MQIPSYPKVIAFGTNGTGSVLDGPVRIDEKIDGSQFGFGRIDGEFAARSHGAPLVMGQVNKMFKAAVDNLLTKTADIPDGAYFYGECLSAPKHNVLAYNRAPKGHVVLFDGIRPDGSWMTVDELADYADRFGIAFVQPILQGNITHGDLMQLFERFSETESALGGTNPEGIVVKNYNRFINLGGKVCPIFTKMVRPQYKEKHAQEWGEASTSPVQAFIASFKGDEARWTKAVTHLREQDKIEGSVRDIGKIVAYVQNDLITEEKDQIKDKLWALYEREVRRAAGAGLAEWYKSRLAKGVEA